MVGNIYRSGSIGDVYDGLSTGVKVMTLPFVPNNGTVQETGWSLPAKSMVLYCVIETTTGAAQTLNVGITGDTDVIATLVNVTTTGWDNDIDALPYFTETNTAKTVVYDFNAATLAEGNIHIIYANLNN